jgi:hypothetical protein
MPPYYTYYIYYYFTPYMAICQPFGAFKMLLTKEKAEHFAPL